jgi:hypothetical protein
MSLAGLVALGIVTVGVATFAALQWLGLRIAARAANAVPIGA